MLNIFLILLFVLLLLSGVPIGRHSRRVGYRRGGMGALLIAVGIVLAVLLIVNN